MASNRTADLARAFIDDSAFEVGSGDDDVEDEWLDDFLIDSSDEDERDSSQPPQYPQDDNEELEIVAQRFSKQAKAHHNEFVVGHSNKSLSEAERRIDYETAALSKMWMIKVKMARGEGLRIANQLTKSVPHPGFAVYAPKLPGRVYVVADNQAEVAKACTGIKVGLTTGNPVLIPEIDQRYVLNLANQEKHDLPSLRPGSFVRIRRGLYAHDVALVISASRNERPHELDKPRRDTGKDAYEPAANSDVIDLLVVPRIDYTFRTESRHAYKDNRRQEKRLKKRRRISPERPAPLKFDPVFVVSQLRRLNLYAAEGYDLSSIGENRWKFMKQIYEHGLLRLRAYGVHAVSPIRPTPEDVVVFTECAIDTKYISNSCLTRVGDRVKTQSGVGVVMRLDASTLTVQLGSESSTPNVKFEVGYADFDRIFDVGQWVIIKFGVLSGSSGMIVGRADNLLAIVDPTSQEMINEIHTGFAQHASPPALYKDLKLPASHDARERTRTSGLIDREELKYSFVDKDALVIRGPTKHRIGRVVGMGLSTAVIGFDGSAETHQIQLLHAVNVETLLFLDGTEPHISLAVMYDLAISLLTIRQPKGKVTESSNELEVDGQDRYHEAERVRRLAEEEPPTGSWLWTEDAKVKAKTFRIFGVLAQNHRTGTSAGLPCSTIPLSPAFVARHCEFDEEREDFLVKMRYNHKNGTGVKEVLLGPKDFDVCRPHIGNLAYLVGGSRKGEIVTVVSIERGESARITGFRVREHPPRSRRTFLVSVSEVTKVEVIPPSELVLKWEVSWPDDA